MGVYIGSSIKLNCLSPWFSAREDLHGNVWLLPRLAHILQERIKRKRKMRSGCIEQLLCATDFCLIPLTSLNKCTALRHYSLFTPRTPSLRDIEHLTSGVSHTPQVSTSQGFLNILFPCSYVRDSRCSVTVLLWQAHHSRKDSAPSECSLWTLALDLMSLLCILTIFWCPLWSTLMTLGCTFNSLEKNFKINE